MDAAPTTVTAFVALLEEMAADRGLTATQLVVRCGIPAESVSRWYDGSRPLLTTIGRLAQLLPADVRTLRVAAYGPDRSEAHAMLFDGLADCGMSLTELAAGLGVTASAVQRWHTRSSRIPAQHVAGVADALDLDLARFAAACGLTADGARAAHKVKRRPPCVPLREMLTVAGVSVGELATHLGVSRRHAYHLLARTPAKLGTVFAVATLTGKAPFEVAAAIEVDSPVDVVRALDPQLTTGEMTDAERLVRYLADTGHDVTVLARRWSTSPQQVTAWLRGRPVDARRRAAVYADIGAPRHRALRTCPIAEQEPFAQWLRRWKAEAGISHMRLAQQAGTGIATVHAWTCGQSHPAARFIPFLAEASGNQVAVLAAAAGCALDEVPHAAASRDHHSRLGSALRVARQRAGMILTEVAPRFDRSREWLRTVECGVHQPPPATVAALAELYRTDPLELLAAAGMPPGHAAAWLTGLPPDACFGPHRDERIPGEDTVAERSPERIAPADLVFLTEIRAATAA